MPPFFKMTMNKANFLFFFNFSCLSSLMEDNQANTDVFEKNFFKYFCRYYPLY